MYFRDRKEAGNKLADELYHAYANTDSVILCIGDAVDMCQAISEKLNLPVLWLLTETIDIPRESLTIGTMIHMGGFSYNPDLSEGQVNDYLAEFHGAIDQEKDEAIHKLNRKIQSSTDIMADSDKLRDKNVIFVADGLKGGAVISSISEFLKPVRLKRLIAAVAVADVSAVDKLHLNTDELHVLMPVANYYGVDHYFSENMDVDDQELVAQLQKMAPKT